MPDSKPSLFRQTAAPTPATTAAAASASAPAEPPKPINFVGVAFMKNGAVYFGEFKADADSDAVIVKVPTAAGDVRTVRTLHRAQIESIRELEVPVVRKLAKIGPHVLAKSDVERVAPAVPTPPATPAPDADPAPQ